MPFVVILFDHRGLVVSSADFVQVRGQYRQTEPPMEKYIADARVVLHVKSRPEVTDAKGVWMAA